MTMSALNGMTRRQMILSTTCGVAIGILTRGRAFAQQYWTPKRGSAWRTALMNAARPFVSNEIGGAIEFMVYTLRTDGNWAFLAARPQRPGGQQIDWATTPFADDWRDGIFDDNVMVLFKLNGERWVVVDYFIGATDVPWYEWLEKYRLSEDLFVSR